MTDRSPFSHPFRVADLAAKKPTRFRLAPTAAERADIAMDLGISDIPTLNLVGELHPIGRRDWELQADLTATVVQPCVVTLVPVTTRIAEKVVRRYLAEMPEPTGDEIEMPEDDTAEPLTAVIDAGIALTEALALALPLYPRAPGAELGAFQHTGPDAEPLSDETVRPFAGLADLLRDGGGKKS